MLVYVYVYMHVCIQFKNVCKQWYTCVDVSAHVPNVYFYSVMGIHMHSCIFASQALLPPWCVASLAAMSSAMGVWPAGCQAWSGSGPRVADAPCLNNMLHGGATRNGPDEIEALVTHEHLEYSVSFDRFFEADVNVICARFMWMCRARSSLPSQHFVPKRLRLGV